MQKNFMKKSLFLSYFFPPEQGGIQNYLYNICKRLPTDKVVVWAPINFQAKEFDSQQKFKIIRKSYNSALRPLGLSSVDYFFSLKRIIKENNIDIIQCGHLHPLGMASLLCKKFYKIPYIIYTHGTEITELENASGFKKKMMQKVLHEAQNIVVTTDFMRDHLIAKFGFTRDENFLNEIFVKIPPGVDSKMFYPLNAESLRARFGISDQKIILTCGRLVPRKNQEMIIKAMPNIIKRVPRAVYYIIGSGPTEEKLKLLIRNLNLQDRIKIFSRVSNKDLNFYYNLADIFVLVSKEIKEKKDIEGFGLVYLEANACKKPVVAGNTGGVAEAVLDAQNGYLVNPASISDVTAKIVKLLRDQRLNQEMGNFGYQRVVKDFSWDCLVEKLKQILD